MPDPYQRPALHEWHGEMVMAEIAYRSARLRRNMTPTSFNGVLADRSNGGVPIPISGAAYSSAEISSDYRVVASTSDSFVAQVLGTDQNGGTASGLQAVVLQHRTTNQ
jgi:hypothetical protein